MTTQPYLIASAEVGLELDREPWLLPDTAFTELIDMYVWRKRVVRRLGNSFLGRLVSEISQTIPGAVLSTDTSFTFILGSTPTQAGSVTITISTYVFTDNGLGEMLLAGMPTSPISTINYITGLIALNFPPIGGIGPYDVVVVYSIFNGLPVMGLCTWQVPAINRENLIAFDTEKANLFVAAVGPSGAFQDISFYTDTLLPFSWSGTNFNFFNYFNYQGAFFATNNVPGYHQQSILTITGGAPNTIINFAMGTNIAQVSSIVFIQNTTGTASAALNNISFVVTASDANSITITADTSAGINNFGQVLLPEYETLGDGIRYYNNDGSINGWVNFNPPLNPTNQLKGGRIIIPYRNRMVILSPIEGDPANAGNFVIRQNRARWSQNGTVFYTTPVPVNQTSQGISWRDDIPGRGGYEDAPTQESIVGAQFIRDILIVFFERSTWALRYTGNSGQPFVWSRVNVELGTGSQFSVVPFDRGVLAIGNRGAITSDGNNVARIDLIIPDVVFNFLDSVGNPDRVYGIRDFYRELVYWAYPSADTATTYPNRILVYNYRENSYSIFMDSYTCFGYYQSTVGRLWNTTHIKWEDAHFLWNAPESQALFQDIVAGTNTGFVTVINRQSGNDIIIAITDISQAEQAVVTTLGSHNLETGQFVKIDEVEGMVEINGLNSQIQVLGSSTFKLLNINSEDFTPYDTSGFVIRLNQFSLRTKQINPYVGQGSGTFMTKMDVYSDYIENGQIQVNVYTDGNKTTPVNVPLPDGPQLWQNVIPLDETINGLETDKTWTRFFCHTRSQFIQIQLTLSSTQMLDDLTNTAEFTLHALLLSLGKAGRLISR